MDRKRCSSIVLAFLAFVLVSFAGPQISAQGAASQTATLRIISTTDLHGQVSTMHYDNGIEKSGSLAQAYTLIEEARDETGLKNTMTVDIGDSLYGYAADYVLEKSGTGTIQPIYKAMAEVGYDAITIGNHDFDYGYQYLNQQLTQAGLKEKCVLSNVVLGDTGKTAWNETRVITKKLKTNKGKNVNVDIGLIGVTIPKMSTKSDCTEELVPLPVIKTVDKQAQLLRQKGVDLVIVLAHVGFGKTTAEDDDNNVLYYMLNTLDNIDAVVAGHGHHNYPSADKDIAKIYKRENVDPDTGFINNIPVTMIKDHGAGIGVTDLKLKITSAGEVTLADAATQIRYVTKDTPSSQVILDAQKDVIGPVDRSLDQVVGILPTDEKIDSYFALLEDNYAIQLVNESKMYYALYYTGGLGKSVYSDYPVLAMTRYGLNSNESADDQIDINGSITMRDILNMQIAGHDYNTLYWITGSQLTEWLEWSASIYNKANKKITSDEMLEKLLEKHGAESIVADDWMQDWGEFAVFDGIGYTIDTTQGPRYNKEGKLKDPSAHRIVSLTYNGSPVLADQKFIIVSNHISTSADAIKGLDEQKVFSEKDMAYEKLIAYVGQQQTFGNLAPNADNNWKVLFYQDQNYIVRSSIYSQTEAAVKNWFRELAGSNDTFAYYLAQFIQPEEKEEDKNCPLLVVSSTVTEETDAPIPVKVQANDESGVREIKWLPGRQALDSSLWETAEAVTGGAFMVDSNNVYSVRAEDYVGNQTVKYVNITNINTSILQAPTINKVSNRSSEVTGLSRYGTIVYLDAGGQTYETVAKEDGTYTCTVERLDAGMAVKAYCMDATGKRSKDTFAKVTKKGPNIPNIEKVSNTKESISGTYTDSSSIIVAVVGSKVYCSGEEGKAIYQNSQIYNASASMYPVGYTQNGKSFKLSLPAQDAGKKVKFYALDQAGRKSKQLALQTADNGPNKPKLEQMCSVEDYVYGSVTNVNEDGTVTVTVGGDTFQGQVQEDGTFAVQTKGLSDVQTVSVVVHDKLNGKDRDSAKTAATVQPYTNYTLIDKKELSVEDIYDDMTEFYGDALEGYLVSVIVNGKSVAVDLDEDGQFTCELEETLEAGDTIYVVARDEGKIAGVIEKKVLSSVPETPKVLDDKVTFSTKRLHVLTKEAGKVELKIDGKVYATKKKGVYQAENGGYLYRIKLPKTNEKQTLSVRILSKRGVYSDSVKVKRKKDGKKPAKTDN